MIKESVTAKDVCELLNELLDLDKNFVQNLVDARVKCNEDIANHPTVQVRQNKKDEFASAGILGVINGIFGIRDNGLGVLCMVIDDNGKIKTFQETK